MPLSQSQKSLIEKARNVGVSDLAVPLDDAACSYLLARLAHDLGLAEQHPEVSGPIPPFFETMPVSSLRLDEVEFPPLAEKLFASVPDADTYFSCLAALHKARLKFERILQRQPFSTMDQVGHRGLLQFGSMSPNALAAFLIWRKWLYDTDNRAAQETGYLFEPILAAAIGGAPVSAARSPVRRGNNSAKGRQVDCVKGNMAYEFKLRVTIAASGQGRWEEELRFPQDCKSSNYVPVLVVLDSTDNPKLAELSAAFTAAGGETHLGDAAWRMLESEAGPTMSVFLKRYIRTPLNNLLAQTPAQLPDLRLAQGQDSVTLQVGGESLVVRRTEDEGAPSEERPMPRDADDALPGA